MKLERKKLIDFYIGGIILLMLRPIFNYIIKSKSSIHLPTEDFKIDYNKAEIKNITVIKLQGAGSLVVALPALLAIKKAHQGSNFRLITTSEVSAFAKVLNLFDEIYEVETAGIFKMAITALRALKCVFRSDILIDLEIYSRLSAVFSYFTQCKIRVGFFMESHFWRDGLFTDMIYYNRSAPIYLFYDRIARLFQIDELATIKQCKELVLGNLKNSSSDLPTNFIVIGPGCSDLASERKLSGEQWITVIKKIIPNFETKNFVILGGQGDVVDGDEITQKILNENSNIFIKNLSGQLEVEDSLKILSMSQAYLGIDSALLHFARLFEIPSYSFWGPTDPHLLLRANPDVEEKVYFEQIPCSPCVHVAETPPCGGNNICIKNLVLNILNER